MPRPPVRVLRWPEARELEEGWELAFMGEAMEGRDGGWTLFRAMANGEV